MMAFSTMDGSGVGHGMSGSIELPVAVGLALEALQQAVEVHQRVDVHQRSADGVDVVGRVKDRDGAAHVRFTVRETADGTAELQHEDLDADGSEELYCAVVDDLLERVRAVVARSEVESDPDATGAYVGTLVGGKELGVDPGRAVTVVFGHRRLVLRYAGTSVELGSDQLADVEAVPTSTAGLAGVESDVLDRAISHAPVGTVIGVATTPGHGLQCWIHVGGATTSIVNAELETLRSALDLDEPSRLPSSVMRRRPTGVRTSSVELIRQMTALAHMHHAGDLSEREWAEAKAKLLGID